MEYSKNEPQLLSKVLNRGFTLIELLVTIAVIGVLAGILIPAVSNVRSKANSAVSASNLRNIASAIQLYTNEHGGVLPGPVWTGQGPRYFGGVDGGSLSYHLKDYLLELKEVKSGNVGRNEIFSYPGWEANASNLNGPSYLFNQTPAGNQIYPFGKANNDEDLRLGPMRMSQYVGMDFKDGATLLIEADQQLSLYASASWYSGLPPKPVHGNFRNALLPDFSVAQIPVGEE